MTYVPIVFILQYLVVRIRPCQHQRNKMAINDQQ